MARSLFARHRKNSGDTPTLMLTESPRAVSIAIDCCIAALKWSRLINSKLEDDFANFIMEIVPEEAIAELTKELDARNIPPPADGKDGKSERKTEQGGRRAFAERLGKELQNGAFGVNDILIRWLNRQRSAAMHLKSGRRDEMFGRAAKLAKMFRLSPCAADIVFTLYLLTQHTLGGAVNFGSTFSRVSNRIRFLVSLGRWPAAEVRQELMEGAALQRYELLDADLDLSRHAVVYLDGLNPMPLDSRFFRVVTDKPLPLEAHADFTADIRHLQKLFTGRRAGEPLNILFYGIPGTGKTALARSLGHAFCAKTYEVRGMDASSQRKEEQFRLSAIHACLHTADPQDSLIIVDEADDVLNCGGGFSFWFFGGGTTRNNGDKGSLNHLLDDSKHAIIWITNAHRGMEESTRRRFDYVVEFTHFYGCFRRRPVVGFAAGVWRMNLAEKQGHWSGVTVRWRDSGLSQAEFCRTNSLPLWKFQYWLRRERRLAAGTGAAGLDGFVRVQTEPERGGGLVLRFPSGLELVIGSGFDEAALRRVVSCLGGAAC